MKKLILFGASGNLGRQIAKEIKSRNYDLTVVVRSKEKAALLASIAPKYIIADVCRKESIAGVFKGKEVVISALGKSVSPNDPSKESFSEVDLQGNLNILDEAKISGIQKFIYISALHAEQYVQLEYFRVHHVFSEYMIRSGIDYSIIKPPAIFSAFKDLIPMARRGRLITLGKGDRKTNPIFEGDLAKLVVDSIDSKNTITEAGGKEIYTRKQLNEIIQKEANGKKKLKNLPIGLVAFMLPLLKIWNRNLFDKFSFFTEVMKHDMIAPAVGEHSFEEYIREHCL